VSDALANLFAKKFIARPDVKAVQILTRDGNMIYMPDGVRDKDGNYTSYRPWTRPDLLAHLSGERSYGHYLLNTDDTCKLFAFDVDLEKTGFLPSLPEITYDDEWSKSFVEADPRAAWRDRGHSGRNWMKMQFRMIAHVLAKAIVEELNIPCAAAYSGNKGIHVYGFTGLVSADEAREGAMIVLDSIGKFEPLRGQNFFRHKNTDPVDGFPNLSIEVFPKQDSLDGKDLGNLMRLPLGKNLKTSDPTFFIDLTSAMADMVPVDAEYALTTATPWKRAGE
jgi:hypothetical protein